MITNIIIGTALAITLTLLIVPAALALIKLIENLRQDDKNGEL